MYIVGGDIPRIVFLLQKDKEYSVVRFSKIQTTNFMLKYFSWNTEKNEQLKAEREISFEEVVFYIERGQVLDIVEHPNPEKYSRQRIFIIDINAYAYLVPFIENEHEIFLKTIIPSRKATRKYLQTGKHEKDQAE